jgi:hypothetical protein
LRTTLATARNVLRRLWSRRLIAPVLAGGSSTAIVTWVFRKQLFDGWSFPSDFIGGASTTPAFVAATIGRGHPLAWSPFVASGFPVTVDPQAGVYFPVWWLFGALHVPLTLDVVTDVQVAHVLLGAIGMMLLARVRRLPWIWATFAGVAYVFFGGFYGQAEHAGFFRGFAYLPWLLWALTPPDGSRRWMRLAVVPLLAWLIATGAYPAQIVSFGIAGLVYVIVALRADQRSTGNRERLALALAVLASGAVCVAVLLPYLRAEQAGELVRSSPLTASIRAMFAISPLDAFGLYLNNFAWSYEGTITAWAIGIPVLVGLACARRETLARHAPLIACGAVALVLGMTPKIGFIGRAMVSASALFPSRFPAADYKATVAVALILLSADSWSRIGARDRRPWVAVGLATCVLVVGALLVPHTYGLPTRRLWLVLLVVGASAALALVRPSARFLACALMLLVVIDGVREANDYLKEGASPWQSRLSELAYFSQRDNYVRALPESLERAPTTRPARVPASTVAAQVDSSGWVADAYHAVDYNSIKERVLFEAEHNPSWLRLLLAPWLAVTFPCAAVGCSNGAVHLPPVNTWRTSSSVRTTSYGANSIVYVVKLSQPTLMIENELAIAGWRANTGRVRLVRTATPFRAWRLPAGDYRFTASFHEPDGGFQNLAVAVALAAWLGVGLVIRVARSKRPAG